MLTPDREERFSILSVPVSAIRWFFGLFSIGTIYLTVTNTLNQASKADAGSWLDLQEIATAELVRSGGAAGVGSAIIVEAGKMVLAAIWEERNRRRALEKGREEGREEGVQKGREERQALWEAWYQRQQEAAGRGEPFDELPPSLNNRNGHSD